MRALLDATIEDLRGLTLIILVATAIVAIAAYLWGRPTWVGAATSSVGAAEGRTLAESVRGNRGALERIGLGVIVFVLVWLAVGLEIALLGAALFVGLQIVLRALSDEAPSVADESPSDSQPAGTG